MEGGHWCAMRACLKFFHMNNLNQSIGDICTCSGRLNCLEKKEGWLTKGAGNSEGSDTIFTGGEGRGEGG